jgi:hypothetical protein
LAALLFLRLQSPGLPEHGADQDKSKSSADENFFAGVP